MIHPRIVVSAASSIRASHDEDVALYRALGVTRVAPLGRKLAGCNAAEVAALLGDAGMTVDNLAIGPCFELARPEQWSEGAARLRDGMELARALGTGCVVITSGPAGGLTWERAADAFEQALVPMIEEARREAMTIAVEHTNGLRSDIGFLFNLRDTLDLAERIGFLICMEVNNIWGERALGETIARGAPLIRMVQVNDFVVGTTSTPDRAVPGDGDIPLERIVRQLEEAGYRNGYEIEIVGPRIETEGYESALRRSLAYMGALLDRVAT